MNRGSLRAGTFKKYLVQALVVLSLTIVSSGAQLAGAHDAPVPLLKEGKAVTWWFVFKFNSASFPGCGNATQRQCTFGGNRF